MWSKRITVFTLHMFTLSGEKPKEKASFYYHSGFALNQVKKNSITGRPYRSRSWFCYSSISKLYHKQPCQRLHRGQNPKAEDLHSVSLSARLLCFSGSKCGLHSFILCYPTLQALFFVFHCCGPAALRSSCIIEILVAALIIFHADLVGAQHSCGVWRSVLMAAGSCSCVASVLFSAQALSAMRGAIKWQRLACMALSSS